MPRATNNGGPREEGVGIPGALEDLSAIPASFCGNVNASIAVSLKRIADMMEDDRKPLIELAPEGWVSADEHRRILREGLARECDIWERIAAALETRADAQPTGGNS